MAIFNSYVSSPEGIWDHRMWRLTLGIGLFFFLKETGNCPVPAVHQALGYVTMVP